jgi:hypothetical protein
MNMPSFGGGSSGGGMPWGSGTAPWSGGPSASQLAGPMALSAF